MNTSMLNRVYRAPRRSGREPYLRMILLLAVTVGVFTLMNSVMIERGTERRLTASPSIKHLSQ